MTAFLMVALTTPPAQAAPAEQPVTTLTVDLVDGSRLVGTPRLTILRVQTPYAELEVPLDQIQTVTFLDGGQRASLQMRNGDQLEGAVDRKAIGLDTIVGRLTVPPEHVVGFGVRVILPGQEGLVLHYRFDADQGGVVHDDSGLDHHGRLVGATPIRDGLSGGAYRFDGRNDYIDCGEYEALQITGELTWSVWFRTSTKHTGSLVSRRRGADTANDIASHLTVRDNGGITAGIVGPVFAPGRGAHLVPGEELTDGKWHHAALVYRPDTSLGLYVDGALVEENTDSIFPSLNPRPLPVRVGVAQSKFWFDGDIDEVQLYERALSPEEVRSLYDAR